jgi:hypothetical protein
MTDKMLKKLVKMLNKEYRRIVNKVLKEKKKDEKNK